MTSGESRETGLAGRARERVAAVADAMSGALDELGKALMAEFTGTIPELQGETAMLDMLLASSESNVATFVRTAQGKLALADAEAPAAAVSYARRLAQRGTPTRALLRAYRLGQQRALDWALEELGRQETDAAVLLAAARILHQLASEYVDKVCEQVLAEYEQEREYWLAHRNTVRVTTLAAVLGEEEIDIATASQGLAYWLRQQHLGLVLGLDPGGLDPGGQDSGGQDSGQDPGHQGLRRLEQALDAVSSALGGEGQPLFMPQDRTLAWGWVPLGRAAKVLDRAAVERAVQAAGDDVHVALGTPASGLSGFRATHLEALRAHSVVTTAAERRLPVTSYADLGVGVAALAARDVPVARELVLRTLGGLAADDEGAERLRETLLVFLAEKGSYQATGERLHLHRNTVKYRLDKAREIRGRSLEEDRVSLEVALLACRWLGRSVLA